MIVTYQQQYYLPGLITVPDHRMNKKLVSNYLMIYAYHTVSIYEQLKIYRHIDNLKHNFL